MKKKSSPKRPKQILNCAARALFAKRVCGDGDGAVRGRREGHMVNDIHLQRTARANKSRACVLSPVVLERIIEINHFSAAATVTLRRRRFRFDDERNKEVDAIKLTIIICAYLEWTVHLFFAASCIGRWKLIYVVRRNSMVLYRKVSHGPSRHGALLLNVPPICP